jgi:hypothetical protein
MGAWMQRNCDRDHGLRGPASCDTEESHGFVTSEVRCHAKAPAACCNTLGRGRLNVITRRLIQITFRDWRGDINHGDTATIISKYRYRLNRPPRPADRQTGARVLGSRHVE